MTHLRKLDHSLDGIDEVIERLAIAARRLEERDDANRYFCLTYLRTTRAVRAEIERGGFEDAAWLERWDVAFALLYLDALERWQSEGDAPAPWRISFEAASDPSVPPLRHVLLGMNAHVNYDLPQSLIAAIGPDEFADPVTLASRRRDCRHIDDVLASRVAEEDRELARIEPPGSRTILDRMLTPFNRFGTARFLAESRAKVWRNAHLLDDARRTGPQAYQARIEELSSLAAARVADLRRPGQVILRLTRKGFGVSLASPPTATTPST